MEEQPTPPKVSALIVSSNSAGALRRSLAALERSLERESLEILVMDNGSRDDSPRLDTEFPNITMLRLPRNFGRAKALNIGARTAAGEYLFLLDPNVEVKPETVRELARRLEAAGDAAAVCPLLVDPEDRVLPALSRLPTRERLARAWRARAEEGETPADLSADSMAVEYPRAGALMVRKQFVRGMNYFDERYGQHWTDAELCFQIRNAAKKILLAPPVRVRLHPAEEGWRSQARARALLSADCALGAAVYVRKRFGWLAGVRFRLEAILRGLGGLLRAVARPRELGFEFARLAALVSGQKIDGSQDGI